MQVASPASFTLSTDPVNEYVSTDVIRQYRCVVKALNEIFDGKEGTQIWNKYKNEAEKLSRDIETCLKIADQTESEKYIWKLNHLTRDCERY